MLFVDFPGSPRVRLRSYCLLLVSGAVLIVLGTLCSQHPLLAVAGMAIIGFGVLFAGIVSLQAATGTMAALLTFVLPVAVAAPPGQIPARLSGWLLAGVLAIPVTMLVWPRPFHDELRKRLSSTAQSLGDLAAVHAAGKIDHAVRAVATAELAELRNQFEGSAYRPTGAAPGDVAVAKLVGRMEWVGANAFVGHGEAAALGLPKVSHVNEAVADVLNASASLICDDQGCPVRDPAVADRLEEAMVSLETARDASQAAAVAHLTETTPDDRVVDDDGRLLAVLDPTFRARALSFAAGMVGEATFDAAGLERVGGETAGSESGTRPQGRAERQRATWRVTRQVIASHLHLRSVWLRNSLRGAVGMALAVAVVEATNVEHGFWVILGAMSVLRSNALGTGATALRALAGTVVGFVIGSTVMVGLADHYALLWALLPVAVLLAGIAPSVISFAAGQAGFTVVVVILFNIIQPIGWKVGLTRIEDVAIGCGVSLVVGLLFWPRGATAALGRALCDAFAFGSNYLVCAVDRITAPGDDLATEPARLEAEAAYRRLDDAFRQYVGERGAKPLPIRTVTDLFTGAIRTRLAAHSLATLPRLPIEPDSQIVDTVTAAGASLARCVQCRPPVVPGRRGGPGRAERISTIRSRARSRTAPADGDCLRGRPPQPATGQRTAGHPHPVGRREPPRSAGPPAGAGQQRPALHSSQPPPPALIVRPGRDQLLEPVLPVILVQCRRPCARSPEPSRPDDNGSSTPP